MPNILSQYALGRLPARISAGSDVVPLFYTITLSAAPLVNDTLEMGVLPAGHVPIDYLLDCDDLDANATPLITLSLGILNAAKTALSTAAADGGAVWASGINDARTGGFSRNVGRVLNAVQPVDTDRNIALLVSAAAATFQAGTIRLTVLARTAP